MELLNSNTTCYRAVKILIRSPQIQIYCKKKTSKTENKFGLEFRNDIIINKMYADVCAVTIPFNHK